MDWHTNRRRGPLMVVAAVAMVALAGCGLRMETPEPEWPSPGPVTVDRDQAALNEHFITQAFGSSADAAEGALVLEGATARTVPTHLAALGGVYRPYDDYELPVFEGSLEEAVVSARDAAWQTSLSTDDADLSALTASIALSHSLSLWFTGWQLAQAVVEMDMVEERPLPSIADQPSPPLVPESTVLAGEVLMDLAVLHDQARYLYETIGARSQDEARELAYARMDIHRARGEDLANLAGVDDRREAIYSVVAAEVTGPSAQADAARAMERAIATTYAGYMVEATPPDKPWLASAAFDAFTAEATLPGFTLDQWPELPGIDLT